MSSKALGIISLSITTLLAPSCIISILYNGLYADGEWANAQWLGQDVVSLFFAAPLLALAAYQSLIKHKQRWEMVLAGVLFYLVYTYAFFMFAANLTVLYFFQFPIFSLSLFGLFISLQNLLVQTNFLVFKHKFLTVTITSYLISVCLLNSIW